MYLWSLVKPTLMYFKLSTRLLIKALFLSLLTVISLNYITVILFYSGLLRGYIGFKVFSLLSVDFDSSLPTILNTILVIVAFVILLIISLHLRNVKSKLIYNWLLLTCAFLLLSLDENPAVHEIFVAIISRYGARGQELAINYAWGMPYGAFALVFVFFLWRFVTGLPKDIAIGFVVSGLIYVFGALAVGLYGAEVLNIHRYHNVRYALVSSFEESLEMLGLTLFIYYLINYIQTEFKLFSLEID